MEHLKEAAAYGLGGEPRADRSADTSGRACREPRGTAAFRASERDETPDVMAPDRGVGNLLSKLIDHDGSFPVDDRESLQNPA